MNNETTPVCSYKQVDISKNKSYNWSNKPNFDLEVTMEGLLTLQPETTESWNFGYFSISLGSQVPNFNEIRDSHFQVADLAWNDP